MEKIKLPGLRRIGLRIQGPPAHVELPVGKGGIKEASKAKCEQITTLDKSFLVRGPFAETIHPFLMCEIEKAIQRAIGIPIL